MTIYLAARYSRRCELLGFARELEMRGHEVTSRWLTSDHLLPVGAPPEEGVHFALEDWYDCARAACTISFTEEPAKAGGRNRGGRHVEFGIAVALKQRVVVIGWRENVFHYLPHVEFYGTPAEALAAF